MCHTTRAIALTILLSAGLPAQPNPAHGPELKTGKQIYDAACVSCHGAGGRGTPTAIAGFERPDTFPDFTRCDQTTPELDVAWKAVIHNGGPFRGFSQIMPAFRDALTSHQMDMVIGYLRGMCRERSWPRGELNLPRAIVTEKAFPENETVVTSTLNATRAPGVSNEIVHEQRFWGSRNQIEVSVPVEFADQNHTWYGGFGDVGLGWKRNVFSSLRTGSILSFQGEAIFPTGSRLRGFGSGVTTFEAFAAYGQLFPKNFFLQFQLGGDMPTHTDVAPQAMFWRAAVGKSVYQTGGLGRMWSPMVEFLADRDIVTGARTSWDIMPEMQVTLSRRQHIRAAVGVRVPVSNTAGRSMQVAFYLLWDWFDGKLLEGW